MARPYSRYLPKTNTYGAESPTDITGPFTPPISPLIRFWLSTVATAVTSSASWATIHEVDVQSGT